MLHQGQFQRYAVKTSDPIVNEGGGGLMGVALAKDFAQSGNAWLYHTYRSNSGLTNKGQFKYRKLLYVKVVLYSWAAVRRFTRLTDRFYRETNLRA